VTSSWNIGWAKPIKSARAQLGEIFMGLWNEVCNGACGLSEFDQAYQAADLDKSEHEVVYSFEWMKLEVL